LKNIFLKNLFPESPPKLSMQDNLFSLKKPTNISKKPIDRLFKTFEKKLNDPEYIKKIIIIN
jgi:hypothetical protein